MTPPRSRGARIEVIAAVGALLAASSVGCSSQEPVTASPTASPTAVALPTSSSGPTRSGPEGTPIATPRPAPASPPGSTAAPGIPAALCDLTTMTWDSVVDPDQSAESQDDALREGVALLEERLPGWQDAATGSPEALAAVDAAASLSGTWRAAIAALDAGDPASANAALARGREAAQAVSTALAALPDDAC
jgi:hypothetical protein